VMRDADKSVALRVEVAAHDIVGMSLQSPQTLPIDSIPQLERSVIRS